jgi:hypothetical protein
VIKNPSVCEGFFILYTQILIENCPIKTVTHYKKRSIVIFIHVDCRSARCGAFKEKQSRSRRQCGSIGVIDISNDVSPAG